ncbi:MAG: type III-B CRISPR module RAMP protein Cmr1 [Armatimonadetes bacterium]|nr:type III-B CRISPR module RAMP protein Cmr1 [Armatimonadota bacterium]MDW8121926.1 type III-B CRISPR module RAMP protein Cmr1 [Armatimonadota bacterium]
MGGEVTLKIETVTPLFLGGADPRGEPELRAASIRGALRFWFRALVGGVIGHTNLSALKRQEKEVFGSTNTASPVVVRVSSAPHSSTPYSQITGQLGGLQYLFFAARPAGTQPARSAIPAGSSFYLTLKARPGAPQALVDQAFKNIYAALWLLTHLGGVGARSRRGAGSLQVVDVRVDVSGDLLTGMPDLVVQASHPAALRDEIGAGLRTLRQALGVSSTPFSSNQSSYDVLDPNFCKIWVLNKPFPRWQDALDAIGSQFRSFRSRRQPDYGLVRNFLQTGNRFHTIQRAAFGLPIVFYFRSLSNTRAILQGTDHDRRASPLFFRVTKLRNGSFVLVLTLFLATLLPPEEPLQLRSSNRSLSLNQPGWSIICDFIHDVNQNIPMLQVVY